jgi:hypothetical protein
MNKLPIRGEPSKQYTNSHLLPKKLPEGSGDNSRSENNNNNMNSNPSKYSNDHQIQKHTCDCVLNKINVPVVPVISKSKLPTQPEKKGFFNKLLSGLKTIGKCIAAPLIILSLFIPFVGATIHYNKLSKQINQSSNYDIMGMQSKGISRDLGTIGLILFPPASLIYVAELMKDLFAKENSGGGKN